MTEGRVAEASLLEASDLRVERGDFRLIVPLLEMDAGRCVGLVGPNGAGKTTLLETLRGRLRPTAGDVRVRGTALDEWGYERGLAVGLVRDELEGLPWMTVREHLDLRCQLFPGWDNGYAQHLMTLLEVPENKVLSQLSKGTKAKVGFISVEAYRPPVLLLDEPTAGLDPVARAEFLEIVRGAVSALSGRGILFSTHLTEDVQRVADRVLVLRNGTIVGDTVIPEGASGETRQQVVANSVALLASRDTTVGETAQ